MPKLHGKPFKSELRAKIRRLSAEESRLMQENDRLKVSLLREIEQRERAERSLTVLKRKLTELAGEAKNLYNKAMLAGLPRARLRA